MRGKRKKKRIPDEEELRDAGKDHANPYGSGSVRQGLREGTYKKGM